MSSEAGNQPRFRLLGQMFVVPADLMSWPPCSWLTADTNPWKRHVNECLCDRLDAVNWIWSRHGAFHSHLGSSGSVDEHQLMVRCVSVESR